MFTLFLFPNKGLLTCSRLGNYPYQSPAHLADKKAGDDSVASKQPTVHPHLDNAPTHATEMTASRHTRSYCRTRTTIWRSWHSMYSTDSPARQARARRISCRKSLEAIGEGLKCQSSGLWWGLPPIVRRIKVRKDLMFLVKHNQLTSTRFSSRCSTEGGKMGRGMIYCQSPWTRLHPRNRGSKTTLPITGLIKLERERMSVNKKAIGPVLSNVDKVQSRTQCLRGMQQRSGLMLSEKRKRENEPPPLSPVKLGYRQTFSWGTIGERVERRNGLQH